jgi:hypothetical protein
LVNFYNNTNNYLFNKKYWVTFSFFQIIKYYSNVKQTLVITVAFIKLKTSNTLVNAQHERESRCHYLAKHPQRFHYDEKLQQLYDGIVTPIDQIDDNSLTVINK